MINGYIYQIILTRCLFSCTVPKKGFEQDELFYIILYSNLEGQGCAGFEATCSHRDLLNIGTIFKIKKAELSTICL